jgi:hypothetical protein
MYYAQFDLLEQLSEGKKWSFAEVRPDGVVMLLSSMLTPHSLTLSISPALYPLTTP